MTRRPDTSHARAAEQPDTQRKYTINLQIDTETEAARRREETDVLPLLSLVGPITAQARNPGLIASSPPPPPHTIPNFPFEPHHARYDAAAADGGGTTSPIPPPFRTGHGLRRTSASPNSPTIVPCSAADITAPTWFGFRTPKHADSGCWEPVPLATMKLYLAHCPDCFASRLRDHYHLLNSICSLTEGLVEAGCTLFMSLSGI